jgi:hypothetical protein
MIFANPFTAARTIREQAERIAHLEAEAAEAERRDTDVWQAYIISKKLQRFAEEKNK